MLKKMWAPVFVFLALPLLTCRAADTAPNTDAAAVYSGVISRNLSLRPDQQAALKGIFEDVRPRIDDLIRRRAALSVQRRDASNAAIRLYFSGKLADVEGKPVDVNSRLEPQKAIFARQEESFNAEDESIWKGLWGRIATLLDDAQTKKLAQARSRIGAVRYARLFHDNLRIMTDNPEYPAVRFPGGKFAIVRLAERAQSSFADPWAAAWKAKDMERFKVLLSGRFTGSSWNDFAATRSGDLYKEYAWSKSAPLGKDSALADVAKFLAQYDSIEAADLTIFGAEDLGAQKKISGIMSVRGLSAKTKTRMETSAKLSFVLGGKEGSEAIDGIELYSATQVVSTLARPYFENATASSGLQAVPINLRNEAIRRGGYALAANTDPDGRMYLYSGSSKGGMLLQDDGMGHFTDVTEASGLGHDDLVKAAVFADFNNDGKTDLLLVRFQYSSEKQILLYEGLGNGKFRLAKNFNFSNFAKYAYGLPMPVAVGDFNGDQKLDFYVGFPGKMDFTTLASAQPTSTPGHPQGLFFNEGDFKFSDQTKYALYKDGGYAEKMNTPSLFPHSAVATDLEGNGHEDLIVVDDRKDPMPIFRNQGDGTFSQVAERIGVKRANWGMSSPVADFNNDGHQDIFLTNVNLPLNFVMEDDRSWLDLGPADARSNGNHLYQNDGKGSFTDVTDKAGVRYAGAAPAGGTFIDFDNDGRQDIYVANGLWSAGPRAKSFDATFLLAEGPHPFLSLDSLTPALIGIQKPANDIMAILQNYVDADGAPVYSLGGGQRNRLYHNNGDGTFTDVSYLSGVDSTADGYVAAVADVNRDGASDLVLRNCDPGTEAQTFPTVELFVNTVGGLKKHLDLRLAGVKSNRDAIGAKVTIETAGGLNEYKELIANNGAVQDDKLIHFGLGNGGAASKVVVRWPAGGTQTFTDVLAGSYTLEEGGKLKRVGPTFVTQQ